VTRRSTITKKFRVGQRMSLSEWAAMPEDAPGELVDGILVGEEVPRFDHEGIVSSVLITIGSWLRPRGGRVYGSEGKFGLSLTRGRKPDGSVFLPGTRLPPCEGPATEPPDITVEVISPGKRNAARDRVEKASEYAAFGVRFYWLIDLTARTLEIFERDASGRYVRALAASQGVVDVPGCPELRLDLDALWAEEIDALPPRGPSRARRKTRP
jgi:Uma2 family endonuclease